MIKLNKIFLQKQKEKQNKTTIMHFFKNVL